MTSSSIEAASSKRKPSRPWALLLLVVLNLVPVLGVVFWGWRSFDLIFLYWLENVVIGIFVLARMLVRPYAQATELLAPLLLGLFFLVHYGMFCYGHGSFVVGLFGPAHGADGQLATDAVSGASGLFAVTAAMLSRPQILLALAALALLQLFEWLKDIRDHGLAAYSAFRLMTQPYRRIIVLHVAILGSGFLLLALDEPTAGLVALVAVKTLADCRQWLRGPAGESSAAAPAELTAEQLRRLEEEFAEPKVVVNGKTRHFDSFAELRASSEFRTLLSVSRMVGAGSRLKVIEAYLERKIAEEQAAAAQGSTAVQ